MSSNYGAILNGQTYTLTSVGWDGPDPLIVRRANAMCDPWLYPNGSTVSLSEPERVAVREFCRIHPGAKPIVPPTETVPGMVH